MSPVVRVAVSAAEYKLTAVAWTLVTGSELIRIPSTPVPASTLTGNSVVASAVGDGIVMASPRHNTAAAKKLGSRIKR